MKIKIKDTTYLRDMNSRRGIVETDMRKVDEYKTKSMMMNAAKTNKEEINMIKEKLGEVDEIRNDINEIKNLLKNLVNKE
jgi:hypothetical protein